MLSLDCISFHSCGLTCTLMAHHGCWVSMVSSSLTPPHQSTYSSQSVARESTSSSASFLTQAPGTGPRGHVVSTAGRQALPSLPAGHSQSESSDFPCPTLLFLPLSPRLLHRHSGPCLATFFLMSFTSNEWDAICAQCSLPALLSLFSRAGTFSVLITG